MNRSPPRSASPPAPPVGEPLDPPPQGEAAGAQRRTEGGKWPLAYALAALVIVLDQLSKWWVLGPLDLVDRGQVPVLAPVFNLTLVHNAGVSFGLLRAGADLARWGLAGFSVVVALALAAWARRATAAWTAASLGLVIGGALGNVVDRARLGYVTDFLDFSGLHFPWVFNVADSAITVGVVMLLAESLFAPKTPPAPATIPHVPPPPPAA